MTKVKPIADSFQKSRGEIIDHLLRESKKAGIMIDPSYCAFVSNDHFTAAFSIVPDDPCDMFGYLKPPAETDLSKSVPEGFYHFDITLSDPDARCGTAALRTPDGKTVLDGIAVEVAEAPATGPNIAGLSLDLSSTEFRAKRWKPDGGTTPGLHFVDQIIFRF